MNEFSRAVAYHPAAVLVVVVLISAIALCGIIDPRTGDFRLTIDPGMDQMLPEGDDDRLFYEGARAVFGDDEGLLIALTAENIFETVALERITHVAEAIQALRGVSRVASLATTVDIRATDDGVTVEPVLGDPPFSRYALESLRATVQDHPFLGGFLVSTDATTAAIAVYFEAMPSDDQRRLAADIADLVDAERGSLGAYVTGVPHAEAVLGRTLMDELAWILPAGFVLAALQCLLAFRTLRGVVAPMVTLAVALLWTLGAMGWAGAPINLVTGFIPPLVVTLGFAAAMHVSAAYFQRLRENPPHSTEQHRVLIAGALATIGPAVAICGLTTGIGFAALSLTNVAAIRDFGQWALVGVGATTIAPLTVLPALLAIGGVPLLPSATGSAVGARLVTRIASFDSCYRRSIVFIALALWCTALVGMRDIQVDTDYAANFDPESPIRRAYAEINDRLGGATTFWIVVTANEDAAFTHARNLAEIRQLQDWLESQPEIKATVSLADAVRHLHRAFDPAGASLRAFPERAALTEQLLLFAGSEVTAGMTDRRLRKVNIIVRGNLENSATARQLLDRIERRLSVLPTQLEGKATGKFVLLNRSVDEIVRGQLTGISFALLSIYLTLAALLTSWRIGFLALLPNLLPVTIYYGTLGWLGVPLNPATSLVGTIALGIAVDDSIHYFARFNHDARRLGDEKRATETALVAVIKPVSFTTLGLCLGFLLLATSELSIHVQFGLLCAFTLAVAYAAELTLSPALCSGVRLVTLWDLLALDLGPSPQREVPLFEGLTTRQARIFALMGSIEHAGAGQRLFTEGAAGDCMYVILDGELRASLQRDDGRTELSCMHRGDIVGEIALFVHGRTADVDVSRDARLLRFSARDLDHLSDRYPRIGAKVNHNLSKILADRVVSTGRALR